VESIFAGALHQQDMATFADRDLTNLKRQGTKLGVAHLFDESQSRMLALRLTSSQYTAGAWVLMKALLACQCHHAGLHNMA
jgi:hypothetical protein